jgi:hypothetical protein
MGWACNLHKKNAYTFWLIQLKLRSLEISRNRFEDNIEMDVK